MNQNILEQRGQTLYGSDGEKVGTIEEIYLDNETDEPEWALVKTGLFGTGSSFVPLQGATESGDGLAVAYDKATIKDAPRIEGDQQLSPEEEAELYRYYGRDYAGDDSGDRGVDTDRSVGPTSTTTSETDRGTVDRDTSGSETDGAITRSEEELRVGTTTRETGRARLRKYVVTENVTKTVPVSREEVRIEREPITDANRGDALSGGDITEAEHEVTLHAEEPVVEKRVVPKERIRAEVDTVTDEQTVSEDVRKEQIDVDEDGRTDRTP